MEIQDNLEKSFASQSIEKISGIFHKDTIGIHISFDSIKIVQIERIKNSPVVKKFLILPIERENFLESLTNRMFEITSQIDIPAYREIDIVLEHPEINMHYFNLPAIHTSKLHETIMWELSKISSISLEKSLIKFYTIEQDAHSKILKIACIIAPKDLLQDISQIVEKSGIEVTNILPIPCALENLSNTLNLKETESTVFLHIGNETTVICFLKDTTLQYSRHIQIGRNQFINSLKTPFKIESSLIKLTQNSAEDFFSSVGIPIIDSRDSFLVHDQQIPNHYFLSLMRPVIEKMMNEIQLSINYYKNENNAVNIQKIFISGEMASVKNIDELINKTLNLKAEITSPFSMINASFKDSDPPPASITPIFAPVLGVCLKSKHSINLLPLEIKLKHIAKKINIAAIIFLIGLLGFAILYNSIIKKNIQQLDKALADPQANYLITTAVEKKIYELQRLKIENQKLAGLLRALQRNTARWDNIFIELSLITPDGLSISEISVIEGKEVIINGEQLSEQNGEDTSISAFLVKLKESPLFENAQLNSSEQKLSQNKKTITNFQITLKLKTNIQTKS